MIPEDYQLKCNVMFETCLVGRNPDFVASEQQMRRPACASAQSDLRICYSLSGKYDYKCCYMQNINSPACLCMWEGGLNLNRSQTLKTDFLATRPKYSNANVHTVFFIIIVLTLNNSE